MRKILALLLCLADPAQATQEYILPTLFDVAGVAADDVLNIRRRPDAQSEIVGTLAPDATRVEVVAHDETGRWGRVLTQEGTGWVSMRYLAYRTDVWSEDSLPRDFQCLGTEPFWSLTAEGAALALDTPERRRSFRLDAVLSPGIFRSPRRALTGSDGDARLVATIVPAACSDGMSDRVYGLDATIVLSDGDAPRMLAGCCRISR